jgi:serine protease Do
MAITMFQLNHDTTKRSLACLLGTALLLFAAKPSLSYGQGTSFSSVSIGVQPKIVKIYGAGGIKGLEAYQSGFLISEQGHILTVWSYVLDTDYITAVLNDGRKFQAKLVGADPRLEIAVLQVETDRLDFFAPKTAIDLEAGDRVLAFSNLFGVATGDEPASVLHGIVSAKTPLDARRGAFKTTYRGPVLILDAMTNNPGAAGGALTNREGKLVGILGKELRNALTNTWLNYAIPMSELNQAIDDILAGKTRPRSVDDSVKRPDHPHSLHKLGIVLVPDLLIKTPPFVDRVRSNSAAAKEGLKADDLILFINDRMAESCKTLKDELSLIDRIDSVHLIIQRGQELLELELKLSDGT